MLLSIQSAVSEIAYDTNIKIVVIMGAGTKTFCAGADLSERLTLSPGEVVDYHFLIQKTMLAIEQLPQPVIAALNGSAFGGGVELALACDLRIMVSTAVLQMTEVRLGIIPGAGGTQRLPRLIGATRAKEMIFAAAAVNAEQACHFGLVNRIVEVQAAPDAAFHQALMDEVRSVANQMDLAAPLALREAKQAVNSGCDRDLISGLALESKAYLRLLNTKDRLEGLAAFATKRQPKYAGE